MKKLTEQFKKDKALFGPKKIKEATPTVGDFSELTIPLHLQNKLAEQLDLIHNNILASTAKPASKADNMLMEHIWRAKEMLGYPKF